MLYYSGTVFSQTPIVSSSSGYVNVKLFVIGKDRERFAFNSANRSRSPFRYTCSLLAEVNTSKVTQTEVYRKITIVEKEITKIKVEFKHDATYGGVRMFELLPNSNQEFFLSDTLEASELKLNLIIKEVEYETKVEIDKKVVDGFYDSIKELGELNTLYKKTFFNNPTKFNEYKDKLRVIQSTFQNNNKDIYRELFGAEVLSEFGFTKNTNDSYEIIERLSNELDELDARLHIELYEYASNKNYYGKDKVAIFWESINVSRSKGIIYKEPYFSIIDLYLGPEKDIDKAIVVFNELNGLSQIDADIDKINSAYKRIFNLLISNKVDPSEANFSNLYKAKEFAKNKYDAADYELATGAVAICPPFFNLSVDVFHNNIPSSSH